MNSIRGKRWVLPLVLLLVIVTASALRWDVEATKTYDTGVLKWERDRWTGDTWIKHYGGWYAEATLALPPNALTQERVEKAHVKMKTLSLARDILAGGMVLWLAVELLREYRKKEKAEAEKST